MKIAVVLNGDEPAPEEIRLLDACEKVVCADGAATYLLKAQRPPDIIVGDLDSLDADTYKWADALDVPIDRHPPEKHETDGELALQKALDMGARSILLLGGHGKRSAMFLANLKLLRRCHDQGIDATMVGHHESLRFVSAGGEVFLTGRTGATLNLLAVDGDATVTLKGTDWDGDHIGLEHRSARGVSNKILSDGASMVVHEGTVMVIVERKG